MYKAKTIIIFGGSGSWGHELTVQLLLEHPNRIIIFSRGEFLQVEMQRKFNNIRLTFVIGDIRDSEAVDQVFSYYRPDYVFCLAALKHVPICENMPHEAVKTNINGMSNLIHAAIKYKAKKFIDVSSDKAVNPCNLYGMTKAIGEKLTIQANCLTSKTDFIVIRGGNVLGTNGSLIPHVLRQIKTTNKVTITDGEMTRFFLTLKQAIKLLLYATRCGIGGETFVINMPSFKISKVIESLILYFGNKKTIVETIGRREGEKKHEELISEIEAGRTFVLDENIIVILPEINTNRIYGYSVPFGKSLNSSDIDTDPYLFHSLLISGGFI